MNIEMQNNVLNTCTWYVDFITNSRREFRPEMFQRRK